MRPADFPAPDPTPISDVSPSLANQLLSCHLRVGFARDPRFKSWRRPTTHTALGLVAHAVTEAAFTLSGWPTDPDACRARIADVWEDEVARHAQAVSEAWAPAMPPPPQQWPGYALTRARTIRRALKHLAGRTTRDAPAKSAPGAAVEVELRDPDSGLFGRADRIERDGDTTRVVDLKTGLHQEQATPEQRRQLLLYAVLVQRSSGAWPSSIAVEDAAGATYAEPLDPAEAEAALADVLAGVHAFNAAIEASTLVTSATPNAERCKWCDFRVLCRPFWSALTSAWDQRCALGSVCETGESDGGPFAAMVVQSPVDRVGENVHIAGLAAPIPTDASMVAIADWAGPVDAQSVRARWSTYVRAW